MSHVVAKFILWLLLPEQKEHRAAVINDLIQTTNNEPDFLSKVITRDESWVYSYKYDLESKAQLSQWKLLGSMPRGGAVKYNKIKTMLTVVFFDVEGVVHHEYAPPGQTINEYYLSVLCQLRDTT